MNKQELTVFLSVAGAAAALVVGLVFYLHLRRAPERPQDASAALVDAEAAREARDAAAAEERARNEDRAEFEARKQRAEVAEAAAKEFKAAAKRIGPKVSMKDRLLAVFSLGVFLAIVAAAVCIYFLPTVLAIGVGHANALPIGVINFFFGWTLLGWVAALVWALRRNEEGRAV